LKVIDGKIQEDTEFVQLVNPECAIPWEAKQVNKISDEEVQSAPTIDQVLPKFLEYAKGTILVAHNSDFDMGFLEHEKECCWGYVELPECLCTMQLSRSIFPHEFRHNLDTVALRLELPIPEARHRALPDVLLTAQILLKMMEMAKISSIEDLRKKAGSHQLVS